MLIWTFLILPCITNATGTEHEKILHWWDKISERKPYKCKINADYSKTFHPNAQKYVKHLRGDPYIFAKPCEDKDLVYVEHSFKGKTIICY